MSNKAAILQTGLRMKETNYNDQMAVLHDSVNTEGTCFFVVENTSFEHTVTPTGSSFMNEVTNSTLIGVKKEVSDKLLANFPNFYKTGNIYPGFVKVEESTEVMEHCTVKRMPTREGIENAGQVLTVGGLPIYRRTIWSEAMAAHQLVQHDGFMSVEQYEDETGRTVDQKIFTPKDVEVNAGVQD